LASSQEIHSSVFLDTGEKQHNGLRVSFLIPAYRCSEVLEHSVLSIRDYLKNQFCDEFEIIIIPNGPCVEESETYKIAAELSRQFPEVKVVANKGQQGKGFSLRAGFAQSLGKYVFFTDADLPYDLSFFSAAAQLLADGVDFISGNRRLPQSHFTVPVYLLNLVYRRHCIGLIFNRVVRMLFPIKTSDTQAGIKAMSRRMAEVAFSRQTCPGFLFDIEFFLCCAGPQFRSTEIPVRFFLHSEKSTVQLFRECVLAGIWLAKIFWRYKQGRYAVTDQLCAPPEIEVYKSAHIRKELVELTSDKR
jgi:dolichyl-phosphate beta-glucosyltransferase